MAHNNTQQIVSRNLAFVLKCFKKYSFILLISMIILNAAHPSKVFKMKL